MRRGFYNPMWTFGFCAAFLFLFTLSIPAPASAQTASITSSAISPAGILLAGQNFDLTATVISGTGSGPTPTGQVSFYDSIDGPLGSVSLGTGGGLPNQAIKSVTNGLDSGSHSVTLTYLGDGNYNSSQTTLFFSVAKDPTTTLFGFPNGFYSYAQHMNVAVTIASQTPGAGDPTGSVTLSSDGVSIQTNLTHSSPTDNYSVALLPFQMTSGGSNTFVVNYSGDSNYFPSTLTQVVDAQKIDLSNVQLTALPSSGNYQYGQGTVAFTYQWQTAPDDPVHVSGTVAFWDGGTSLGTTVINTFSKDTPVRTDPINTLPAGTHTISACYGGDTNYNAQCVTMSYNILPYPTGSMNLFLEASSPIYGSPQTFGAQLPPPIVGSYTGTMVFTGSVDGFLGQQTVTGSGAATLISSTLSIGLQSVTAVYSGDNNFKPVTATHGSLMTAINSDLSESVTNGGNCTVGEAVSMSASVTATSPTLAVATGPVSFFDQSTGWIGNGQLDANGKAYLNYRFLSLGSHSVTLYYPGDSHFNPAAGDGNLSFSVQKETATVLLTSDASPANQGDPVVLTASVEPASSAYQGPVPTGPVSFYNTGTSALLGAALLQANGLAQFSISSLPPGTTRIYAQYQGDSYFAGNANSSDYFQAIVASTPTYTPTVTFTPTPTFTPTATFTPTVTYTPTPVFTATATPTPTATPNFQHSNLTTVYLGPNVVDRGQPVCLYMGKQPVSGHWVIFNVVGERVSTLDFGSSTYQCWPASGVAAGYYVAHVEVQYSDGTSYSNNFHMVVK